MSTYAHVELLPTGPADVTYRHLTSDHVSTVTAAGRRFLQVEPEALRLLTAEAMRDISHLFRTGHLASIAAILDDPEASANDRFVALELLKNANIAAGGVLPSCQDTGTAIIWGHKGERVLTGTADEPDFDDAAAISQGVADTFLTSNLRYSQMAPLDMFTERNTGNNLPAQIEIYASPGDEYELVFMAKGGGSANKSFLFQETKALLNPDSLTRFLDEKLRTLGTSACPPYHLAVVIGGTSAEFAVKVAKYASAKYLDTLPTAGGEAGHGFRDLEWEGRILELTREFGIGAQFGGKYFCHDVRVVRLPRHGASCPVGIAVSCSADRQALGRITADGIFLEQLETDPARFLPETEEQELSTGVVPIDVDQPMDAIRNQLTQHPVKTRLSLTGTLVVARDIAHAKLKERLDAGEGLPDYLRERPVYYAGPAKTPEGYASGSFGPTTAGAWIPTWSSSKPLAAALSCWPRATGLARSSRRALATAASTWAPLAARQPGWPRTRSARSRCSNTPSSAWKPSGKSRWKTSQPSSWWTTRATTSSAKSRLRLPSTDFCERRGFAPARD